MRLIRKIITSTGLAFIIMGCKPAPDQPLNVETTKEYFIAGEVIGETFMENGKYCLNRLPIHYFTILSEDKKLAQFLLLGEDASKSDALVSPHRNLKIRMSGDEGISWDGRYNDAHLIRPNQISLDYSSLNNK